MIFILANGSGNINTIIRENSLIIGKYPLGLFVEK
jgi:hypothetical protein